VLPKNTEIEAALASYQRLFAGDKHAHSLQAQRRVALQAIQLLEKFEPRLVGAVPSVRFEMEVETIEAFVFEKDGIRQAPVSPVDGKPMRRAGMAEVSELIGS
jgi:hypothetical protein